MSYETSLVGAGLAARDYTEDRAIPAPQPSDMAVVCKRLFVLSDRLSAISGSLIGTISRLYGEGEPPTGKDHAKPIAAGAFGELLERLSGLDDLATQIASKAERLSQIA